MAATETARAVRRETDAILRVERAAARVRETRAEYRAALVAAHAAGLTFAELGALLGVSKQAVHALVTREESRRG